MTKSKSMNTGLFLATTIIVALFSTPSRAQQRSGKADNTPDWFYPAWAAEAPHNIPIVVRDTDSALGRYNLETKELGLKDLVRAHGHLCDGMAISFVQIKAVLARLFPEGVVDRTDLRAVSKNGPCWVDTITLMTGARINFKTLRIDQSMGNGFVIQRISNDDAYAVHLREGIFPSAIASLEAKIRHTRAQGKPVLAGDIDAVERMHQDLIKKLLATAPAELLKIDRLDGYKFIFSDFFGERGDVINKEMPRD